jgi:hypothetical protein
MCWIYSVPGGKPVMEPLRRSIVFFKDLKSTHRLWRWMTKCGASS